MTISDSESKSLSWIRVIAMSSIVICHFFQTYHSKWSDVFNIGVQMFLVLSGYLYGHKEILNWRAWAKNRIRRVYLPYLLFMVAVIPLYAFFHKEAMNWKALPVYFLNLQGFRLLPKMDFLKIEGIRHVWFITAIMCAYFTTPLLQRLRKYSWTMLPVLMLLVALAFLFTPSFRYVFVLSWVYLYAIGYLFANLESKWRKIYLFLFLLFLIILMSNIHWENFRHPWSASYRLVHDLAGIVSVIGGVKLLSRIHGIKTPRLIRFLDKYSFPIFLVHFIIIHGPFSMAFITPHRWANIFIMLVTTSIAATAFIFANKYIDSLFARKSE